MNRSTTTSFAPVGDSTGDYQRHQPLETGAFNGSRARPAKIVVDDLDRGEARRASGSGQIVLASLALQIADDLLAHLSPLGWEHINLTGDYVWKPEGGTRRRPLRQLRLPIDAEEPSP